MTYSGSETRFAPSMMTLAIQNSTETLWVSPSLEDKLIKLAGN